MKTIKFSKYFQKLEKNDFFSIRNHDKDLKLHEVVEIQSPNYFSFKAKVVSMTYVKLSDIPNMILCRDLDKNYDDWLANETEGHLLHELLDFYPELTWESFVYLYLFKRCDYED